jgi:fatty-acyl-CoA synthase
VSAPSYAHGASGVPLRGETIGANLQRTVERSGDREALVVGHQGYRATYRQLWAQTGRAARGLIAHGIQKGDRVGIWAPNRYEWVIAQYATARVGAILVNVNPAYKATELAHALSQSGARLLLMARGFRTTDYVALLREVRGRGAALPEALVLDDDWDTLLRAGDAVDEARLTEREGSLQFDDPINIQYTVRHHRPAQGRDPSHHNVLNNDYFIEALRYTDADRVCIPVPLLSLLRHGPRQPRLHDARRLHRGAGGGLRAHRGAFGRPGRALHLSYGVPTMFLGELDHPRFAEFDLSSLRTDHGRIALPHRGHEARAGAHAHERGHDLLRDDGDLARPTRASPPIRGAPGLDGGPRTSTSSRSRSWSPETGAIVERGTPGSSAPADTA